MDLWHEIILVHEHDTVAEAFRDISSRTPSKRFRDDGKLTRDSCNKCFIRNCSAAQPWCPKQLAKQNVTNIQLGCHYALLDIGQHGQLGFRRYHWIYNY